MAHDFLIFDFGNDEETAQQARRKVDNWIQGFRLGKKMILKYEREDSADGAADADHEEKATKSGGEKKKAAKSAKNAESPANVRVLIRLDFSDHEKLSHQRWLDRIPTEEPFKSKEAKIVRQNDPKFIEIAELFDTLT
jgi:hypothetical protein